MIAVDTNLLVYAHRADSPFHAEADKCLIALVESGRDWAIPWPCVHEFIAIVTHPRIFNPPTPLADASDQVLCWLECPNVHMLAEADGYWEHLNVVMNRGGAVGPLVHDARIVALCLQHRVTVLWSADRDFSRFPGINVENPVVKI